MNKDSLVEVELRKHHQRNQSRYRISGHLVVDGEWLDGRRVYQPTFEAPAIEVIKWNHTARQTKRALSQYVAYSVEFDDYEEELDSPFGRAPADILVEDGFVVEAATKFNRTDAHVVAGLSQAPIGVVLTNFHSEFYTNPKTGVFCQHCGEEHRNITTWPLIQQFTLQCKNCGRAGHYPLDDYVPDMEMAADMLNNNERRFEDVTEPDVVIPESAYRDTETGTIDVQFYASEGRLRAHLMGEDTTECGRELWGDPIKVYDTGEVRICGNCK